MASTTAHSDWIERVRILELENQRLMSCQEDTIKDTNRKLLLYLTELQNLRAKTERLTRENDELKRLCVFLDEDREQLKQSIDDWKQFGSEAAEFMEKEVIMYKEKLQIVEERQDEVLAENQYLRSILTDQSSIDGPKTLHDESSEYPRDAGDGSSETESADLVQELKSKQADVELECESEEVQEVNIVVEPQQRHYQPSTRSKYSSLPRYISNKKTATQIDTTACFLECIRNLETRLRKLESTKSMVSSPPPHLMQTSMSAPELELVCKDEEDNNPSFARWTGEETNSLVTTTAEVHQEANGKKIATTTMTANLQFQSGFNKRWSSASACAKEYETFGCFNKYAQTVAEGEER